jgi:Ca2+-transporting ATPase
MTKANLLVCVLGSSEIMENASVICTDKTGTLTQSEMSVVAGSIGINVKFVSRLDETLQERAMKTRAVPTQRTPLSIY